MKRYEDSLKLVDRCFLYEMSDAVDLVIQTSKAKFDETIEVHMKLGVDGRRPEMQVRGTVVLPNGTGKTQRILVFAKNEKAEEAKAAGADYVGDTDLAEKIQNDNWFEFDVIVTTPDMMSLVGKLGKVLGPKGLMPNPKAGTVTPNVGSAISEIRLGKVEYKLDKSNIIHSIIGKASFEKDKLLDNLRALVGAVLKAKPSAAKGQYVKSIVLASTMGPGIKINPFKLVNAA